MDEGVLTRSQCAANVGDLLASMYVAVERDSPTRDLRSGD